MTDPSDVPVSFAELPPATPSWAAWVKAAMALMHAHLARNKGMDRHESWCEVELGKKPDGTHGPCDCGYRIIEDMRVLLHGTDPAGGE